MSQSGGDTSYSESGGLMSLLYNVLRKNPLHTASMIARYPAKDLDTNMLRIAYELAAKPFPTELESGPSALKAQQRAELFNDIAKKHNMPLLQRHALWVHARYLPKRTPF
ncbi:MAG: hypothetical protein ACXW4B_11690 [Micavibrio sp.]